MCLLIVLCVIIFRHHMSTPRKRARPDSDDELYLYDLSERFHSFCYPQTDNDDDSSNTTIDDLCQRLNEHDLQYRSQIHLNLQNLAQEINVNEKKLAELQFSIEQIQETLKQREKYLKLAKVKRRQQSDYVTMYNKINHYQTRENLERKLQQLTQEYDQQKAELNHLNQRLIIYQKQSKVVLYSLLELVGFIDVKLPINFEDEIGRLDSNPLLEINGDK